MLLSRNNDLIDCFHLKMPPIGGFYYFCVIITFTMSKTIVNIIDKSNPLPAYLFTKEVYSEGDKLLFISTTEEAECIGHLATQLGIAKERVESILIEHHSDQLLYERICRVIKERLNTDTEYYLNLAGGSRYMTLSVQHVFEEFHTYFFYTQTRENLIVKTIFDNSIYDDDDEVYPISYRIGLNEYFKLYGLTNDADQPRKAIRDAGFAKHLFYLFTKKMLGNLDYNVMTTLRLKYRNSEFIKIEEVEHPKDKKMTPIPNLSKFLDFIGFIPEKEGYLQKGELEYLTGGWFEEYVYYFIKATLNPQDIAMGVHISNNGLKHDNELDVCFMKANKLYVIECKTGVYSESLFNDIVYKVCALKEVLLGTSNSYIFSLKNDYKGEWKKTANYMDIIFCDYSDLTSPFRMNDIINDMAKVAHEEIQH